MDIVPIIATPSADNRSKLAKTPKILGSVACRKGVAGCGPDGQGRRGWSVVGRDNNILEDLKDARGIVLVDTDEDVSLDPFYHRWYLSVSHRELWTLWCNVPENRVRGTSGSSRITFTTTRSSLKPSVGPQWTALATSLTPPPQSSTAVVQVGGVLLKMAVASTCVLPSSHSVCFLLTPSLSHPV